MPQDAEPPPPSSPRPAKKARGRPPGSKDKIRNPNKTRGRPRKHPKESQPKRKPGRPKNGGGVTITFGAHRMGGKLLC